MRLEDNSTLALGIVLSLLICYVQEISASGNSSTISLYPPLTQNERIAIEKFRNMINLDELYQDFMRTDDYLIRWIRASDFDLESARTKLKQSLNWRIENGIDKIIKEDFSFFRKICPFDSNGRGKLGQPVIVFGLGQCDLRKILLSGKADLFQKYIYYVIEFATSLTRKLKNENGFEVRDLIGIVDTNGFNLRQHACLRCIKPILSLFTTYEDYYPEYLYRLYVINFPRVAIPLFNIVFGVLSSQTKEIAEVYGFDRNEWEQGIRKVVEPNQLSFQYGGTINN